MASERAMWLVQIGFGVSRKNSDGIVRSWHLHLCKFLTGSE